MPLSSSLGSSSSNCPPWLCRLPCSILLAAARHLPVHYFETLHLVATSLYIAASRLPLIRSMWNIRLIKLSKFFMNWDIRLVKWINQSCSIWEGENTEDGEGWIWLKFVPISEKGDSVLCSFATLEHFSKDEKRITAWKCPSLEASILHCNPTRSSVFASPISERTMFSFKHGLYILIASVFLFHLLPSPVVCDDTEKDLLRDINTYRKVFNLPVLDEREKASCLAEEIAEDLEKTKCEDFRDYYPLPGYTSKIPNFQKNVEKCKININTTREGVVMPVCVPDLDSDNLFSNYTKSNRYTKYLNNSKYKIAGIGSEEDWMVIIISTNTSSGDFSSATSLLASSSKAHFLALAFFFTLLILLFN
ncbi:hypothetical protein VNO78_20413 [Psophocarpus tetragonolobus]|uniref:Uncharacterized GPI-anchored protein At5g19230-like domain-containing protein n=1 Tax=Psophocarpus tetragonolobus TaxID=3891 RepID=A0AAN9XGQ1_PSOTE